MVFRFVAPALFLLSWFSAGAQASPDWPEYGGNLAGQRYSAARQITRNNVTQLGVAWTFHTHALDDSSSAMNKLASFQATPVLWKNTLYLDTPFDQVFALDAKTGTQLWNFDPGVKREHLFHVKSRGVALWHAARPRAGVCGNATVLVATLDRRLIARDAQSGEACPAFGDKGTVDLTKGVALSDPHLYFFTSPPIVVGNTIVLGSSVADNQQLFAASGAVRGFDAITGRQLWSWDPVQWTAHQAVKTSGSGNAWTPLAADAEHDLVFIPTGSASLDYFGGSRLGDNRDADSIVALQASTGKKVWAFQLVHHDVWDYDVASQPLLFTFRGHIPAVAVTNKTGMIYVFNRLTGEALYPIVERPVPQTNLPGEVTWPTQPFSSLPPLFPLRYTADDLRGTAEDKAFCRTHLDELRNEGLFTPPSESGTLIFPGALGGPNWGSSAFDTKSGVMYTRVSMLPYRIRMLHNPPNVIDTWLAKWQARFSGDVLNRSIYRPPDMGPETLDRSVMVGAPYKMDMAALVSPRGVICAPPPFGRLVATNLNTGQQLWSVAHGTMIEDLPGSIGVGGPIVTAGGLVFIASTNDPLLRAYDAQLGRELWKGTLPATANATPMTYVLDGRQYVVIAVGGHRLAANDQSDAVIAFALPEQKRPAKHPSSAKQR